MRKAERESIIEREKAEEAEDLAYEEQLKRKDSRKVETRQIIASEINKEQEGTGEEKEEWDPMPPDNDDEDEAAEYEAWKIRELRRVRRHCLCLVFSLPSRLRRCLSLRSSGEAGV